MSDPGKNEFRISVVTPTLRRAGEVEGLLKNLLVQDRLPFEVIIVDGASPDDERTQAIVAGLRDSLPFDVVYIRQNGGTAVQRNFGIDISRGDLVAFIDDDVRLEKDFFVRMVRVFEADAEKSVGGVVGFRTNEYFDVESSERWRWYSRLRLFSIYEPGRYDFKCGYPINNNLQPPFAGVREVDFMTTACAVWRREVFDSGLRFDAFFQDYGVLEDAHLALRAGQKWKLLQCGDARCEELRSPNSRSSRKTIGYKCVVNYYYVFQDIAGPLTLGQKFRFWRFQMFEFGRIGISAIRRGSRDDLMDLVGRANGILETLVSRTVREYSSDRLIGLDVGK